MDPSSPEIMKDGHSLSVAGSELNQDDNQKPVPDLFILWISPEMDNKEPKNDTPLAQDTSPDRPRVHRSPSSSPEDHEGRRFLPQHSPTSSPKSRFDRCIKKGKQHVQACPFLSPKIREIRPKVRPDTVNETSSPRMPSPQRTPTLTPDSVAKDAAMEVLPEDLSPLPEPVASGDSRGRHPRRFGSVHRARNTPHRRSLSPIDEEDEGEKIGLGIRCA